MGYGLQLGFEVVGGTVAQGRVSVVEQLGTAAQLLRGRLRSAALRGQAQGLGLDGVLVLAPFVRRLFALFCAPDLRTIRPAAVRQAWTTALFAAEAGAALNKRLGLTLGR